MTDITAVWANTGEDKVTQDELRATQAPNSQQNGVVNSIWDGTSDGELDIELFGARNETVSFNLILEAAQNTADDVTVSIAPLRHEQGNYTISSKPAQGNELFNWVGRNIELFHVDYLKIEGLSRLSYPDYDERLVPERFRRPFNIDPFGRAWANQGTTWEDRPDHDKYYPDIAVPIELVDDFDIAAGQNQSIWGDIYIPTDAPTGTYTTTITVREEGQQAYTLPLELEVKNFTLPDDPTSKTMVGVGDITKRYGTTNNAEVSDLLDTHFQMAHRHRISLINTGSDADADVWQQGRPDARWESRLDGSLFTPDEGYAGPGVGVGNGVFSIGTYRDPLQGRTQQQVWQKADEWVNWFNQLQQSTGQDTDYFVYLTDEPGADRFPQIQQWLAFLESNPGVGQELQSLLTVPITEAQEHFPSLDIPASTLGVWDQDTWQAAFDFFNNQGGKDVYMYNGSRPASGSFATEDDGVALRQLPWGQEKMGVDRWFYWESTYYDNFQGNGGDTNVFEKAQTFGYDGPYDDSEAGEANRANSVFRGRTGFNYTNGDGVLFYPGTDKLYPDNSYEVDGPLASLRLKHWRRGIQDIEYVELARKVDAQAVDQIIQEMVPEVLWEYGVYEQADPTYQHTDISWSTDPDVWEEARVQLTELIERGVSEGIISPGLTPPVIPTPTPDPTPSPSPVPPTPTPTPVTPTPIPTPGPSPIPTPSPTPEFPRPTPTPVSKPEIGIGSPLDDALKGDQNDNVLKGFGGRDRLSGKGGNDILKGGKDDDILKGGKGRDRLFGQGGDDILKGGKDKDELRGGGGADRLIGGSGNDVLIGGKGNDTLIGGKGNDTFEFRRVGDREDTIKDFHNGDKIDLRKLLARSEFGLGTASQKFDQFVETVSLGSDLQVRVDKDGSGLGTDFTTLVTLKGVDGVGVRYLLS